MLKKDLDEKEIRIYELYVNRIMKHYDLRLSHFKIYFGFNSGLLIVTGFLLKPYISILNIPNNIPDIILSSIIFLSIIGILFTFAWFLVGNDDRKWQLLMNGVIENIEIFLFSEHAMDCALYKQINENYSDKNKVDIIDANLRIIFIFMLTWLFLGFLSAYFLIS